MIASDRLGLAKFYALIQVSARNLADHELTIVL